MKLLITAAMLLIGTSIFGQTIYGSWNNIGPEGGIGYTFLKNTSINASYNFNVTNMVNGIAIVNAAYDLKLDSREENNYLLTFIAGGGWKKTEHLKANNLEIEKTTNKGYPLVGLELGKDINALRLVINARYCNGLIIGAGFRCDISKLPN